ncbi:hypothetical protein DFA_03209 [Cavenderia fasciculata]|uniref:Uncharacterized protein n=1 Tax=Cavenderia fasciculata TaxID=261658 RepID=F4PGY0_CACFS|nr:uncharacterized protein DFA_03209 [Cavenderia fasciculata]EGG24964.1 hypothetical protein DFA_03209 [Cavenderia fasciculata]|eukprot:XP_004362815.1 hypothetical protein DFA_03209 [Cavenderia fasciculata]
MKSLQTKFNRLEKSLKSDLEKNQQQFILESNKLLEERLKKEFDDKIEALYSCNVIGESYNSMVIETYNHMAGVIDYFLKHILMDRVNENIQFVNDSDPCVSPKPLRTWKGDFERDFLDQTTQHISIMNYLVDLKDMVDNILEPYCGVIDPEKPNMFDRLCSRNKNLND